MTVIYNMKVNNINNTNFESRNPTIRFADHIARKVNTFCPCISSSLMGRASNASRFVDCITNYENRIFSLNQMKEVKLSNKQGFANGASLFIKLLRNFACGNCGEAAEISAIFAIANGLTDCFVARMQDENGDNIDHNVLYVNDGNKPYIIDSWLGFADYLPNALIRYQTEFNRFIDLGSGRPGKIRFVKTDTYLLPCLEINPKDLQTERKKLKRKYPQIFLKKGNS